MPFSDLEPKALTAYFVGRQDFITKFKEHLNAGQQVFLIDTVATYGSGKSTILSKLYWDIKEEGRWIPIWLPLNEFSLLHTNIAIQHKPDSLQAMIENLFNYRDLLTQFAANIKSKAFTGFEVDLQRIIQEQLNISLQPVIKDIDIKGGSIQIEASRESLLDLTRNEIKAGDAIVNVTLGDTAITAAILATQDRITHEFTRRFKQQVGKQKYIVFADDFCWIIGSQIGQWFLRGLVKELRDTVVVVVLRTDTGHELKQTSAEEGIVEIPLGNFSFEEVSDYLKKRLGASPLLDEITQEVYAFGHGHPLMTAMIVDLIRVDDLVNEEDMQRIKEMPLKGVGKKEELEEKIDQLIEDILKEIRQKDPQLEEAFCICSIVRRYDHKLVSEMLKALHDTGKTDVHVGSVLSRLKKYSFVEQFQPPKGHANVFYSFHFFIRERMEIYLEAQNPDLLKQIHEAVIAYYKDSLFEYGGTKTSDANYYIGLFRFEEEAWQIQVSEWLYHLALLSRIAETGSHMDQDRSQVELWFTKAFLEAFNWWGWYIKFPFCDQLLYEWGRIQPEDDRLLGILKRFYQAYPEGLFKHGKEGWQTVRESLYSLQVHLNIDGDDPDEELPEDAEDARLVRAMSDWFIAQACRFGPKAEHDTAEEHYLVALKLFERMEDEWNVIWSYSYLADLYLETGQFNQAISNAQQSIQIAQKGKRPSQQDHEVLSQNYRILGDVYRQQKDLNHALRDYARSIYHAYLFQAIPEPPDRYTLSLYQDTRKYVLGILVQLWQEKQQEETLAACRYLHDFWSLYWEKFGSPMIDPVLAVTENRLLEIDSYLFPAEPREDQLGQKGEYMDNIAEIATRMSKQVKTAGPAPIVHKL